MYRAKQAPRNWLSTHLICRYTPSHLTGFNSSQSPNPSWFLGSHTMDFALPNSKRFKSGGTADKNNLLSDLPTHLPNSISPKPQSQDSENTHAESRSSELPEKTEEKSPKNSAEPIFIEGTNITLQTEEDIAKWIAERRKNWPTRKNIELRKKQQEQKQPAAPKPPKAQVCKFFARSGKCKFGNKCRNLHEAAGAGPTTTINGLQIAIPQRYKKEMPTGSLYKNLVQRDLYEHENNVILDFLQYLGDKNLIDKDASI